VDTSFAAMLMQLAAIDAGLGCLFFGIFKVDEFRQAFNVPPSHHPIGALALGYPAADRPSLSHHRPKRPLAEIVHRGTW
jgi:nitroreductase